MIGGKEIVVHHLATQFSQLGHTVRLVGPSGILKHRKRDFGYPVDRFPSLPLLNEDQQWRVRSTAALLRRKYDVVHAHVTHPCAYAAARAKVRLGISTPLVVTPHGADIHKVPELNFGKRLNPELNKKIEWVLQNCSQSTAISESVRLSLIDAGSPPEKITDIPNGVDVERFAKISSIDARAHMGIGADKKLLISTGNYHPRKGHEVLIDALKVLNDPSVHLAIIGRQDSEFVSQVQRSTVAKQVSFMGMIPFPISAEQFQSDVLAALLQQADLYISASRDEGTEGLSLAVLEAMSAGCCAIVTDVSGNRDVVSDHQTGRLIPPNAPQSLANAIEETLADKASKKRMACAGRKSVDSMSWRAIAKRYLSLYEEVVDKQSGQANPEARFAK